MNRNDFDIDQIQAAIDIAEARRLYEIVKQHGNLLAISQALTVLLNAEKNLPKIEFETAYDKMKIEQAETNDWELGYEAGRIWNEDELLDNRQRARDLK
jgi:hypothetical protein